jgi:hypothetical protein
MQARAFVRGLQLNPADYMLRQAYWDAVLMMSQARVDQPSQNIDNTDDAAMDPPPEGARACTEVAAIDAS